MKWFFALNEESLRSGREFWEDMIFAALRSARARTTLKPCMIFDGGPDPLLPRLEALGVTVLRHRVSFYDRLQDHYGANPSLVNIASGAFLRTEIPLLEQEEDVVLYTDCDVMFEGPVDLEVDLSSPFMCAPEFTRSDYANFNTGVMVMNLPHLRKSQAEFTGFIRDNLDRFATFDQDAYRLFYGARTGRLAEDYNWKPYWGLNPGARVVHFHGLKPAGALHMLGHPDDATVPTYHTLFHTDREGYKHYLARWTHWARGDDRPSKDATGMLMNDSPPAAGAGADYYPSRDPALRSDFLAVLSDLNERISITGEPIEGNVCYWHDTSAADYRLAPPTPDLNHAMKRANLWTLADRSRSMVEIGLNGGHSALICLMSNPTLHFFGVDICAHEYTRHAAAFLKERFGRRFHFFEGDSREVLPRLAVEYPGLTFDLMHVDGGHGAALAYTDISNCLRMKGAGANLIFDDVNAPHLSEVLETFIKMGHLYPSSEAGDLEVTPLHEILAVK